VLKKYSVGGAVTDLIIQHWPIEKLIPYARNPRINDHAVEQMAGVISEFGFRIPIIARSSGEVVDGHLRLKAAHKLGLTTIPVALADTLSDAQIKAFRLLANRSATWADWDDDLLKLELEELQSCDFDLSLTGFDVGELAELLADDGDDGLTDEDEIPATPDNPITKFGDVWLLGKHRLMCGDSTKVDDVKKLCADQQVDLYLTDPPYNVAYGAGAAFKNKGDGAKRIDKTILNDDMSHDDFRLFLRDAFAAADAVMKPGAVFYIWHADTESLNFRSACNDAQWEVRQCLIWKKSSLVMGRQDYHWKHEPCLYGWKSGAGHLWASDRSQTTILEFDKPSKNVDHPTTKPLALFEYQMHNNTKGGDIVLDSFGGSGTTLLAAEKNGRIARLMELDPKYCDVIVHRWQNFTGEKATLESSGVAFDDLVAQVNSSSISH
jgi:site-specific DNA-methyltransferase (adenine-specific)